MSEDIDEVYTYSYGREHLIYNDMIIQASDRLMSIAFRAVSGTTKRSSLESMLHVVYRLPLGYPCEGITSDVIIGKSVNIDYGKIIFSVKSEDSYRIDLDTGEEVELENFYFTGTLSLIPSEERVELTVIRREKSPMTKSWLDSLLQSGCFSIMRD